MVEWTQLLPPIALSAVCIFVVSSVIHMVLKYHNADYRRLPHEEAVLATLKQGALTPGQYIFPHCMDHKQMNSPEVQRKFAEGPVGSLYIRPSGAVALGPFLMKWFGYSIAVSAVVAYLARVELPAGSAPSAVLRLVGTATWLAYSWAGPADSIWKGKPWAVTGKDMFDGLIYGLVTGGVFAWLWPR